MKMDDYIAGRVSEINKKNKRNLKDIVPYVCLCKPKKKEDVFPLLDFFVIPSSNHIIQIKKKCSDI